MRTFSTKQKVGAAVLGAGVIAAALGGVAYAYWSSTGTGTGSATTGTSSAWKVDTSAATGDPLTPGGPTDTIAYTVTNQGSGHQFLNTVVISVADSTGSAWTAVSGCSAADYALDSNAANTSATDNPAVDIAPGDSYTGSITIQMVNRTADQDGCKGATVPLYLSAS